MPNFKRLMLEELDRLVGRNEALRVLMIAFQSFFKYSQDHDDYFQIVVRLESIKAEQEYRYSNGSIVLWEYVVEAFDGNIRLAWNYISSGDNFELLCIILVEDICVRSSAKVHKFLRSVLSSEEEVKQTIEKEEGYMAREYDINYKKPRTKVSKRRKQYGA